MHLYPWQKECLRAWSANNFHGIANVVTGAGKTIMALYGARLLKKHLQATSPQSSLRVKIVVPTLPLATQWALAMQTHLPDCRISSLRPGFLHSTRKDDPTSKYMIYLINSARYCLARHILADIQAGHDVLLIADECHRYASPENQKIFDFLTPGIPLNGRYHSLGLSATPQNIEAASFLASALGHEIFQYGFSQAIREKNICDFFIYQIALSFSPEEREEYNDISDKLCHIRSRLIRQHPFLKTLDRFRFFSAIRHIAGETTHASVNYARAFLRLSWKRQALNYLASARIDCAVSLIGQLDPNERILVFGERIQQAEAAYQALARRYGSHVGCYHSLLNSQARKNVLARFRDGSLRILICCRALDEGIDVPDAATGIVLSSSSVSRQRIQRLGRILRRQDKKTSACLYYLYIQESTDDSAFLTDSEQNFTVCNLSYHAASNIFIHPDYERTAATLLSQAACGNSAPSLINEMRRCLQIGLVRSDWLLAEAEYEEKIRKAENQKEKNYWICMKRMGQVRASLY
jgi:superfamily II DNA or RNA helicase